MHPLASSTLEPWLLTYVLNALWQIPVVFAAAWLASRASRRAGPAFQHTLWTTALFAEVLLPAISASPTQALQTIQHWLKSFHQSSAPQTAHITITMGQPNLAPEGLHLPPTLLAAAAILYLAALLYFATRLATGLHQTASLRRRAQPLPLNGYAGQSYHRFSQLFRVNNADVAASSEIASPITLGIRRPTLLLPAHIEAALLAEDLDAALAHEFAHMRRRDFVKNLLYELISLPIAFHPVVWLTRRRMSETRELVCDAMAADAVAGRQRYARSLLRLAMQFSASAHAPTPHAIGIFDAHPFKNFERRVMNLTHHSIELRGAARLVPAALSIALIAGACTSALAFRQQVAAPQTTTPPPTVNLAVPTSDLGHVIPSAKVYVPPSGTAPSTVMLAIPRPTSGQPAQSFKADIADASGPNPVVKALTPPYAEAAQSASAPGLHVSGSVIAGSRITFVEPVYPPDAKAAKLNGTVVLHAIIGKDGTIKELSVLSGPDQFRESALTAVKQWVYRPYLLNGNPVEVDTTITINYALSPEPSPDPSPSPNPSASNSQSSAMPDQVMHIGGNVKPPVVVKQALPEYSQQAKAAKFSGTVQVYVLVDKNGYPTHIRVVKGVGMGLDEKAVEAVSQYRFKPATLAGMPVAVDLYIDVNFQML